MRIWDRDQAAIDEAKAKLDGLGEITSDTVELAKPDWSTQRLVGAWAARPYRHPGQQRRHRGRQQMLGNALEEWRDVMDIDLCVVPLLPRLCRACSRPAGGAS